jgi:hypothetical protein
MTNQFVSSNLSTVDGECDVEKVLLATQVGQRRHEVVSIIVPSKAKQLFGVVATHSVFCQKNTTTKKIFCSQTQAREIQFVFHSKQTAARNKIFVFLKQKKTLKKIEFSIFGRKQLNNPSRQPAFKPAAARAPAF